MSFAQVVIEMPTRDEYAERLLSSLNRTFEYHCPDLQCTVVPKYEFAVERTFELGASTAMKLATEIPDSEECWQVYLAPRHMTFCVNQRTLEQTISGVLMAVARKKRPVALFLCTIMTDELPELVEQALYHKVDGARRQNVTTALQPDEERAVERIRDAVVKGYVGAITKSVLN